MSGVRAVGGGRLLGRVLGRAALARACRPEGRPTTAEGVRDWVAGMDPCRLRVRGCFPFELPGGATGAVRERRIFREGPREDRSRDDSQAVRLVWPLEAESWKLLTTYSRPPPGASRPKGLRSPLSFRLHTTDGLRAYESWYRLNEPWGNAATPSNSAARAVGLRATMEWYLDNPELPDALTRFLHF